MHLGGGAGQRGACITSSARILGETSLRVGSSALPLEGYGDTGLGWGQSEEKKGDKREEKKKKYKNVIKEPQKSSFPRFICYYCPTTFPTVSLQVSPWRGLLTGGI